MRQRKPLVWFRNPGPGSLGRGSVRTLVSGEAQRHVGCLGLRRGGNAGVGRWAAPLHPDLPWAPLRADGEQEGWRNMSVLAGRGRLDSWGSGRDWDACPPGAGHPVAAVQHRHITPARPWTLKCPLLLLV